VENDSSDSQQKAQLQHDRGAERGAEQGVDRVGVPAWAVSLIVHVAVLLTLASLVLDPPGGDDRRITVIEPTPEVEDPPYVPPAEIVVSDQPAPNAGAASEAGEGVAQSLAATFSEMPAVPVEPLPELTSEVAFEPVEAIPTATELDMSIVVPGQVGIGVTGAAGAVDRLTGEIRNKLDQRPTLVCWLFDQSLSLEAQRREIAERLQTVFEELGATKQSLKKPALTNMVIGFGEQVNLFTSVPTGQAEDVVEAIRSIPIDESGAELTFTAVIEAANRSRVFRTARPQKNVMMIVFTDEVGNDQQRVDEAVHICRSLGIPVYVVGVPAPFGMREVRFKFVDPDPKYFQEPQWAQIEQGPESYYPEVVHIRSGRYADEAMDSGFGPYALSRLCSETSGMFFCVHANREHKGRLSDRETAAMSANLRYFFDSDVMREYAPAYLPISELDRQIAGNAAVRALVLAARGTELSPMENPVMQFPRRNDGELVRLLGEAQKVAAKIEPKINAVYSTLFEGLKDRENLTEKRWQAGYDLALGRVMAMKVRTEAYNRMLAQAKSGMNFQREDSDTWELVPDEDITQVGSQLQKIAAEAVLLLQRVIDQHPGTPWALVAEDELRMPLGYVWRELHTGINDPQQTAGVINVNNNNNVNNQRPDEQRRMLAPPKPRRDLKRL
jgi:hypothetical protein